MRIVFFGTPPFAAHILRYLLEKEWNIVAVVTQPDRPKGRSQQLQPSAVKEVAVEASLPLLQPEKASAQEFVEQLRSFSPDLFVVVAYGEIFKQHLLDLPPKGCINVHLSLLPKYRGAAPVQRCLMNGDRESGICIMEMALQLDAGDILAMASTPVPQDMTAGELTEALADLACPLLQQTLSSIEKGTTTITAQDPTQVTFAPKITAADRTLDWNRSAEQLHNQIRALSPEPGAYCIVQIGDEQKRLTIKKSALMQKIVRTDPPGSFFEEQGQWVVACGEGILALKEVQLEGKKSLSIQEFMRGMHGRSIKIV
jgi:methionyl-tRNA formyltransferase